MNTQTVTLVSDTRMFWIVGWPICTAIIGAMCAWFVGQQQRDADLAMRPPIVVMNVSDWVLKSGEGATDAERFRSGGDKADEAARKLEAQGVLVLDSRIVRASPAVNRVSAPDAGRK